MNGKQSGQVCHSLSELSPDVFSHPVWMNFVRTKASVSVELIQGLLYAAQILQTQDDLNNACQLLLICAVLQNRLDDYPAAQETVLQVLNLAESYHLAEISKWACWGAGALCAGQGDYQQAVEYLHRLCLKLNEDNQWVLADVVEVIRQTLLSNLRAPPLSLVERSQGILPEATLNFALAYLLHWGEPPLLIEIDYSSSPALASAGCLFRKVLRSFWYTTKRVLKGELRLGWIERVEPPPLPAKPALSIPSSVPVDFPTPIVTLSSPLLRPELARKYPALTVYCLGPFRVYLNDEVVDKWSGHKAKNIFKYLVTHHERPVNREILIDLFWGEVEIKTARKNLHQAIYTLRHTLSQNNPALSLILLEDDCYFLNPDLELWVDSDAFTERYQAGQRLEGQQQIDQAVAAYEAAHNLYQGEFLAEDRYEDWPIIQREELKQAHLDILERLSRYYFEQNQLSLSITFCRKILLEDNCREDAHRRLMRCYLAQGQPQLALRQYHLCVETLNRELEVPPMAATSELYQKIRKSSAQF